MRKSIYALLISFCLTTFVHGQSLFVADEQKLDNVARAIAHAEGFGVKRAVPTRYHNPGDMKALRTQHYPGQVGLSRNHYVIFKNDAAGFAALKGLLTKIAQGRAKRYGTNPTILQMSKTYASGWRIWSKNVCKHLNTDPSTRLRDYIRERDEEIVPPVISSSTSFPIFSLSVSEPIFDEREFYAGLAATR